LKEAKALWEELQEERSAVHLMCLMYERIYCFEIKPAIIQAAPAIIAKTAIPIIKPK